LGLDRTRWPELLVGLERVEVLEVARASGGQLHVAIETTDRLAGCPGCGCRARVKDRDPVPLADLPVFGSPVELVWLKRRWRCPEPACPVGSWTEDRPDIAPARAAMTSRAGQWATREVGAEVHTVTYAARRNHILYGDATGGGHLWPGLPGKTPFPKNWSADRVMHEISDVATDPNSIFRQGRGGSTIVTGTRDGVDIRVILRNGEIVTAYPTNLPRNP
jgi:hypothetical protein